MIELVFIACLKTAPAVCDERRIGYLDDVGLTACMIQAQPQLAQWMATHPNLTVARWSCSPASSRDFKA